MCELFSVPIEAMNRFEGTSADLLGPLNTVEKKYAPPRLYGAGDCSSAAWLWGLTVSPIGPPWRPGGEPWPYSARPWTGLKPSLQPDPTSTTSPSTR